MKHKTESFFGKITFLFLFSLFISYIITVLGILGLAFLLLIFHMPIEITDRVIYGIYGGAVLAGALYLGRQRQRQCCFWGLLLGIFYSLFLFMVSGFLNTEFQLWKGEHGVVLLTTVFFGSVGGLLVSRGRFCK